MRASAISILMCEIHKSGFKNKCVYLWCTFNVGVNYANVLLVILVVFLGGGTVFNNIGVRMTYSGSMSSNSFFVQRLSGEELDMSGAASAVTASYMGSAFSFACDGQQRQQ